MSTDTIGTGGTHSTISAWEAQRVSTEVEIGELKAEAFNESVEFNGVSHTATNYGMLCCESGAYHDGRSNAVSGAGNARVYYAGAIVLNIRDENFHIKGVEIDQRTTIDNFRSGVNYQFIASGGTNIIQHCLIHGDQLNSTANSSGIATADSDLVLYSYRNIIYGFSGPGIYYEVINASSKIFYNTVYECNYSNNGFRGGIINTSSSVEIKYNAVFENLNKDIFNTTGDLDYNYCSDTSNSTETNGASSLTDTDNFTAPSTTWSTIDLTVKSGADLIDNGVSLSTTTYPDIDIPCNNIEGSAISGTWDIGACEFSGAAPATKIRNPLAGPLGGPLTGVL